MLTEVEKYLETDVSCRTKQIYSSKILTSSIFLVLNQAARELMLAQSSDWPFIMSTGTTTEYATRRFNEHIIRFNRIYQGLTSEGVSEAFLSDIEAKDNLFPRLDYHVYE